ncbi:amidohydrolase family protein [Carboxylicivirga sp. RSCT41]|uniref:amidohydrolase family protein n=1 Tax=Carboxylicivirga agarovorans TaxID=3417570 RepID=UPI003D33C225
MEKESSYSMNDFYSIKKIDAHLHYYTYNEAYIRFAQKNNMHLVSINVDFMEDEWMQLSEQKKIAGFHKEKSPDIYSYIGAVPLKENISPDVIEKACQQLEQAIKNKAIGVKIWKNVGMKISFNDSLVMIDNAVFTPLLKCLENLKFPLLGHFGEPLNCWLPLDKMTVESDKKYYSSHPEFHMNLQPDMPGHADQINACNQMLADHPRLNFIGAHLGSSEYSIDEIARRLDKYPNMNMDLAERVCHLQHQAISDHQKVYDFMIKYQDRLIYGSDMVFTDNKSEEEQIRELERRWISQWQFFTQTNTQNTWEVNGSFKGLGLPKEVINKIYFGNAIKTYPALNLKTY